MVMFHGFIWVYYGFTIGLLWVYYGFTMVLYGFIWIYMGLYWFIRFYNLLYSFAMVLLWFFIWFHRDDHGIILGCGFTMVFQCFSYGFFRGDHGIILGYSWIYALVSSNMAGWKIPELNGGI